MPSAFVPFMKNGGKSSPPAALATDSAAGANAFAALVSAPPSLPTNAGNCAHAPQGAPSKPTVSLQKDGDHVTHIRIECACGEVIELECAY